MQAMMVLSQYRLSSSKTVTLYVVPVVWGTLLRHSLWFVQGRRTFCVKTHPTAQWINNWFNTGVNEPLEDLVEDTEQ